MLLAAAALVAVAFAVPAVASAANWKQEGKELTGPAWTQEGSTLGGAGGSFAVSGTMTLNNESFGGAECPVSAVVSLNPNSGNGQLKEFTATAAKCRLIGFVGSVCGEDMTSLTLPDGSVAVTAAEAGGKMVISTSGFSFYVHKSANEYCPEMHIGFAGKLTLTPNSSTAIGNVSLSADFNTYVVMGGEIYNYGIAGASGTLNVSPSGKYGISSQRTVNISGTINGFGGSWASSCAVTGTIVLEPGSAGKLTSLAKDGSGPCKMEPFCPEASAVSVGSPWTLKDEGGSIKATGVSVTFSAGECSRTATGELTLKVDKSSAISSMSPSGVVTVNGLKSSVGGTLSWSPAGIYGL